MRKKRIIAQDKSSATSTSNDGINSGGNVLRDDDDINQSLPAIIALRAVIVLAGINLSDRLMFLPERLGNVEFVPFFNILIVFLTILYLVLWRLRRYLHLQLYFQILVDIVLATFFVAGSREVEGPFVSFYLLIIAYSGLALGKNAGIMSAALSAICYSGIVVFTRLGIIYSPHASTDVYTVALKIGFYTLGFMAVAYLGSRLHLRLHVMEHVLKERNESLTQLYLLNNHIISSIRSGLITIDLNGRVTVFNAAAGEMMEKKPDDVIGTSICKVVGEVFWEFIRVAEMSRNARPIRYEEWIRLSDDSMRFLGFAVSPLLDANNEQIGYIISFQDLTEIKKLEEKVRRRENLSAIGRMAAVVAHEIRNPLTAMRGSVEILRARANLAEKDERLFKILISESDRLDSFIEDFLNFARPKPRAKTVLDLIPVLSDSVTLIENSPEIKGKYTVSLDIETPDMLVLGNADQIRQVFWNVTQNAIRAMPDGGKLAIRAIDAGNDTGEVTFTDNGIGMTPEEIEQIFQPFHSGFSKGIGLGLSIIFQIMDDHHGRISFESEKRKGTKVILSFPLETAG